MTIKLYPSRIPTYLFYSAYTIFVFFTLLNTSFYARYFESSLFLLILLFVASLLLMKEILEVRSINRYLLGLVVDGDDWVIPQEFQKLLDALKDKQADMVITGYAEQHVYNNTSILKSYSDKFEEGNLYTGIPKEWIRMHTLTYKRSILVDHNIRLSEKTFYVDVQYTLFPLEYVASYKYIKADVYQYFIGREDQSMNLNVMKQKRDHHDRVVRSVIDFYALTQKPDIIEVLDTLLTRLINDQVLINLMSDDGDQLNRELFAYMEQKGFKFKLNLGNKTSGLAYINYQTKGVLSWLIKPLINKKIASYQDAKSLRQWQYS